MLPPATPDLVSLDLLDSIAELGSRPLASLARRLLNLASHKAGL